MADKKTTDYYATWLKEKARAQVLGKPNYEKNCDVEIARLEKEYPELKEEKIKIEKSINKSKIKG